GKQNPQRFRDDEGSCRAMLDRRPYRSSYLTDTFDSFMSGIPAALRVMSERPELHDSMRYDSKHKRTEYVFAVAKSREKGLDPSHIVESELDDKEVGAFAGLRKSLEVPAGWQFY